MISNVGSEQEERQCGIAVRVTAHQPALHGALAAEEALTPTPINVPGRKQTYFPSSPVALLSDGPRETQVWIGGEGSSTPHPSTETWGMSRDCPEQLSGLGTVRGLQI